MFLFYQKHNEFAYDQVNSITEVITNMALYVCNNFNHNIIICILLFLLMITVLKHSK